MSTLDTITIYPDDYGESVTIECAACAFIHTFGWEVDRPNRRPTLADVFATVEREHTGCQGGVLAQ